VELPGVSFRGENPGRWAWQGGEASAGANAMKLFIFASFLAIGSAHADLFESYAKLKERYGEPVSQQLSDDQTTEFRLYRWKGFIIDGRSNFEAFTKQDGAPMSFADMEKVVPGVAFGGKW